MAPAGNSGGWTGFAKTVLIPLCIALALYISIFHAILPLYRRYQSNIARYASYTPLSSGLAAQTTSLFNPIIEPSRSLWARAKRDVQMTLWRWAVPGVQHVDLEHQSNSDAEDEDGEEMRGGRSTDADDNDGFLFSSDDEDNRNVRGGNGNSAHGRNDSDGDPVLFDEYTAGNLVGFDVRSSAGDGRRFGLGRRRAQSQTQAPNQTELRTRQSPRTQRRGMERRRIGGRPTLLEEHQTTVFDGQINAVADVDDSNRRLSRELEEGFRDDSSHSEDELEQGVTVGRKSIGRR